MRYDVTFTNGVIKSREKDLLGGKIEKMAESSLAEAFDILKENGFGGGAECDNPSSSEELFRAEEENVNDFIREYSSDEKTARFLLADYDFHNAEAFLKSKYFGADENRIVGADGFIAKSELKEAVDKENYSSLPSTLAKAVSECAEMHKNGTANGFKVDCAFKRQLFFYLKENAKGSALKKILEDRADGANVSSALRCSGEDALKEAFVTGGKIPFEKLCEMRLASDEENFKRCLSDNKRQFSTGVRTIEERAETAFNEKIAGQPLRAFERQTDDYPAELLALTRHELKGAEPLIGYVYARRAEIKNARIVMVCLNAGLDSKQIRERLRKVR